MRINATFDPSQHIGANGRIVHITADHAFAEIFEQWQCECVAHSVDVYVCENEWRNKLCNGSKNGKSVAEVPG